MDRNLRAPHSWLALAGLFWLEEGDNPFGSAADNPVRLPARAPDHAGLFHLEGDQVRLDLAPGVQARLNDSGTPAPGAVLRNDREPEPDYFYLDDLRLLVIRRGERLAIRLWDPQHPKRLDFQGRTWYAPNPSYRLLATIEAYQPPKQVLIDDMIGNQAPAERHAALVFILNGVEFRLDAERRASGHYHIVFKDATAGKGTYPAARFVNSGLPQGDQVELDFNRAYSPPCAFTDYATCPLPTPENVLPIEVEAGETYEQVMQAK